MIIYTTLILFRSRAQFVEEMREVTNLHLSELYRIWTEMGYETTELNQRMVRFQNIWLFDKLINK